MGEFTQLLERAEGGDPQAAGKLLPLVYEELRRVAVQKMAREGAGHTLQPTALVHEAWMRLGGDEATAFKNRAHYVGAAAEAMRRILIEHARRRQARKRGSGVENASLEDVEIAVPMTDDQLLDLDEALEKLAVVSPQKAELVKMRFYGGFDYEEIATTLDITVPVAKGWWTYARSWLKIEMQAAAAK